MLEIFLYFVKNMTQASFSLFAWPTSYLMNIVCFLYKDYQDKIHSREAELENSLI